MLSSKDVKSEVEFYLVDAFEIFHYLPICQELVRRGVKATIVAEPCSINTSGSWFDYDTAIRILEENRIPYSVECNPDACVSLTTQMSSVLKKYKNCKINIPYGISLIKSSFSLCDVSCSGFDAKLVHGFFSKKTLLPIMDRHDIHPVGYPKHDSYFRNKPQKETILQQFGIDTNKPIIVYLPTYDDDSSIQMFCDEINALRDKFYILTKPHHCTARLAEKKHDLDTLYAVSDCVVDGNFSFSDVCSCADFYITDAKSGASLEALYINPKPAIFLTPRTGSEFKQFYSEIFKIAPVINAHGLLASSVEKTFKDSFFVDDGLMEFFLGKRDGHSSERAANVIMKYCQSSAKEKMVIANQSNVAGAMNPGSNSGGSKANADVSARKAIQWLHAHSSNGGVNVSHTNAIPYPEVTGYLIPTLLQWGEPRLAMSYARWLLSTQSADGSFSGPGMSTPFAFDTGQIIRGLAAIMPYLPEAEKALQKACDWVIATATPDGRLALPENLAGWCLPGGRGYVNEAIHLYVLPGLVAAGEVLNQPKYIHFAQRSLHYYVTHCNLTNFFAPNMLLHFYCYIQEALFDLGAGDICRLGMRVLEDIQDERGFVPAYANVSWACTPGVIQAALVWLKMKDVAHALPALNLGRSLQTASGGFPGSAGDGAEYFAAEELSWAAKFYLDALHQYEQRDISCDKPADIFVQDKRVRVFSEQEIPIIGLEQKAINHLEAQATLAERADSSIAMGGASGVVPTLLNWGRRDHALALVKKNAGSMEDACKREAAESLFDVGDLIRTFRQPEVLAQQGEAQLKQLCLKVLQRQRQLAHEIPGLFYCFSELLHAGAILQENSWTDCARSWANRQERLPDQPSTVNLVVDSVSVGHLLHPSKGLALLRKVADSIGLPPQDVQTQRAYASVSLALAEGAWILGDDGLGQTAFCRGLAALANGNSNALRNDVFDAHSANGFLRALAAMQRCRFAMEFPQFRDDIASDDGRLLFVHEALPQNADSRILDIGTAKGRYLRRLRAMGLAAHLTGQDVHPSFFPFMPKGVATGVGTVLRSGWEDASFDAVTLCEVLEHCIDLPAAIHELGRILAHGGKLIVIDKNIDRLAFWPGGIPPWEQWFDREALADMLRNSGFVVEKISADLPYEGRQDGLFFGLSAVRNRT